MVISAIVLITVIYLLLLRFRLNPLGQNASVKSSDGVIVDAFGISDSYAINSAPLDGINLLSLEGALQVQWSELAAANLSGKGCLLGEGAYGFVVKAIWKPKLKTGKKMNGNLAKEVAIKVLKLSPQDSKGPPFEYACQLMKREANVMKSAERLLFSDCVTKVYGVVQGPLPEAIARIFDLRGGINCVGMVMRYEPGGDLSQYIHCPGKVFRELTLIQKLHILVGISNGISELHGIGIVHGDIKPENILLSSELNPEIRLSDFGLSIIRDEAAITNSQVFQSSLQNTKSEKARGTPLYSAPELLFNPLVPTSTIAKASRKADIYSFAIVVWEVMSQKLPFSGIKSVEQLSWSVQQNVRPLLDDLPHYTPAPISSMISSCWNKNRSLRWIATQCYSTISLQYQQLLFTSFDIYISHSFSKQFTPFLSVLFSELTKCGYRVWFDQNHVEIEDDVETSRIINNCKIFLACVESGYQRHNVCMKNLETITNSMSSPTSTRLVTLVLEADPFTWASNELRSLCAFKTSLFADISSSASVDWALESETTPAALQSMRTQLSPLLKLLSENGCPPTYKVRTGKGYDSNAYSRDTLPVSDVDIQKELSKFP